jgi:large subunit ribosomal protein L16
MLQPKRVKFRKAHRGRMTGRATRGAEVAFGEYGLQSLEPYWVTARQLEAARRAIVHHIKRGGKLWVRVFPDHPVSAKPAETRMGGGKGVLSHWVVVIKPGRVLFELAGVREETAREAFRLAGNKLPVRTQFVTREDFGAGGESA